MTLITGVAKLPSGEVYPNAEFIFWQANRLVLSQAAAVVPPVRTVVTADDVGEVSFDLLPGNYTGRHALTGVNFSFVVPDTSTAAFEDCVTAATLPDVVDYPASQVSMTGGGTAQDYAGFETRAMLVTWLAGKTPALGSVFYANGAAYRYIGAGTAIADLPGCVPAGEGTVEHWGGATSTANFTAAVDWMLDNGQPIRVEQFMHPTDLALILAGTVTGQNGTRVAGNIQAMHDAIMTWWNQSDGRLVHVIWPPGYFRPHDELFSETFAQALWDIGTSRQNCRIKMTFNDTTFWAASFTVQSAVRTSGFWAANSIAYAVPKALFRWEQQNFHALLTIDGTPRIIGNRSVSTDVIGFKFMKNGNLRFENLSVRALANIGLMIENQYNSDIYNPILLGTGYQPTECGGTGLMSSTVRFSNVGTTVTATEAVFDASMVGRYFTIEDAGDLIDTTQRKAFQSTIASYVSSTQITLTDTPAVNATSKCGSFAAVRISTTAGSTAATLSTSVSQSLVGRYITLLTAGDNLASDDDFAVLTTVVTAHSGTSITLGNAARFTTTNGPLVVAPAVLVGRNPHIGSGNRSDDISFHNAQFESGVSPIGSAVPIVIDSVSTIDFPNSKFHGTTSSFNNFASAFCAVAWGWTLDVFFDGAITQSLNSPYWGQQIFTGGNIDVYLTGLASSYPASSYSAPIYIDQCTASPKIGQVSFGMNVQYPLDSTQVFSRFGAHGTDAMLVDGASSRYGFGDTPIAKTSLGRVIVGGDTLSPSAIMQVDSTTQGVLPPRMTTTQKNAIAAPATGLMVFDTTLGMYQVYTGAAWVALVTSPVLDTNFTIQDNLDPTKQFRFDAANIPTGTTLFYTLPGVSGQFVLTTSNITFSAALGHSASWYGNSPAPFAPASAVTLTLANLQTGCVNYTGAAANLTMPLATALDVVNVWGVNQYLEFDVLNTGSGTATIVGNTGVTLLGNMAVPAGASAIFRIRKAATSTYVVMRRSA